MQAKPRSVIPALAGVHGCGLFIHRVAVLRHIAASPVCRAAKAGIRTIQVEALAGDVMAGAGGAEGPAPDVRHQPPGDVLPAMQNQTD